MDFSSSSWITPTHTLRLPLPLPEVPSRIDDFCPLTNQITMLNYCGSYPPTSIRRVQVEGGRNLLALLSFATAHTGSP